MDKEYEYIKALTDDEKRIFVECFCALVYADGNVAKEEIEFLKEIGKLYNITEQAIVSILKNMNKNTVLSNLSQINNRFKALQLIKELCYLANSDTGLEDSEIDFIIDAAERLGVNNDKLKQINKWVLDKIVLQKTGDIIFEKE